MDFVISSKDKKVIYAVGLARYDGDRGGAQEDDRTGGYKTGIPPKKMQKRKKISISLSYEGKEAVESVLNYTGKQFEVQFPINGKGEKSFLF